MPTDLERMNYWDGGLNQHCLNRGIARLLRVNVIPRAGLMQQRHLLLYE